MIWRKRVYVETQVRIVGSRYIIFHVRYFCFNSMNVNNTNIYNIKNSQLSETVQSIL